MNPRSLILIAVALIGVIGVVFFTRSFLTGVQQQAQQAQTVSAPAPTAKILVAAKDLPIGTILTPEDVAWQPWPQNGINDAYFNGSSHKLQDVDGKVVRSPMSRGEPVTATAVISQGERGFLAAILTSGMRAVTIKLSPVAGIGGFVFPGDRVDVILTHTIEVSRAEKYTAAETVFQNVRVLAVDQRSAVQDEKIQIGKTATIEVTPKMAEKVAMLEKLGVLSLSLRSLTGDDAQVAGRNPDSPPISITTSHTLGHEISRFLPEMDAEAATNTVRVSRGNKLSTIEIGAGAVGGKSANKPGTNSGSGDDL